MGRLWTSKQLIKWWNWSGTYSGYCTRLLYTPPHCNCWALHRMQPQCMWLYWYKGQYNINVLHVHTCCSPVMRLCRLQGGLVEACTLLTAVDLVQYTVKAFLVTTRWSGAVYYQWRDRISWQCHYRNWWIFNTLINKSKLLCFSWTTLQTSVDTLTYCRLPNVTFRSQPSVVDRPCDTPAAITAPEWIIGPSCQTPTHSWPSQNKAKTTNITALA